MKAIKVLGGVGLLVIILVAAVVFFVLGNLNQIIKEVVETKGPEVTQTIVTLRDVNVELQKGRGELNNFVIGNPEGFDSEYLLKWDSIVLQVDPASVTSDVVVIKDVVIDGVNIKAEQKGTSTNLQKLLDTLDSGESGGSAASSSSSGESEVKLALERMRFSNNSIDFITEKFGSYELELPSFELSDIGDKNTGLTPEELGVAILKPLIEQAKDSIESRAKDLAKEELEAKVEEKKEELKAKADEKKEELESKLDEEKDKLKDKLGKDAEDKLKGLFKKD